MDNSSDIILSLSDGHATEAQLQTLTQDVAADLRRHIGLKSALAQVEGPSDGYRGDALAIGTLVVHLLSSGAAAALVNLLIAHFARKPHLSVQLKRADGDTLTITGDDTDPKAMDTLLEKVRRFLPE